jgi:hypothetical protein
MEKIMTISLKLLEGVDEIEKKINSALADQMNTKLFQNANKIANEIRLLIPKWIGEQPEIQALLSGDLIGQFGTLISPQSIVSAIINSVSSSMSISLKKFNSKLQGGGLDINIQPDDFANLLSLPQGHTIYSGGDLHWLQWMLLRGDEIIIVGYEYNPRTGIGRTRLGNMVSGKGFRVPPQYSGTESNNFITRALIGTNQSDEITKIFKKVLQS